MKNGDSRQHSEVAVFSFLEQGLTELGLSATESQVHKLQRLTMILDSWANRINLTGHRSPEQIAKQLVLDAAALAASVPELGDARTLADLGTGAGFPGLPLAILFPHLEVSLVDSRLKRNHFQKAVRRELGLERIHPLLGRSDEIEVRKSDVVVAQAMTQPDEALSLMSEWGHPGSLLVLPASETASRPCPPTGHSEPILRTYQVPLGGRSRKVWITRKAE